MIDKLEEKLNYKFKNRRLLETALSHSSYTNENRERNLQSNERMEFLGDSVLGLTVSDYLFTNLKAQTEGTLTKLRSVIVCEQSLCEIARELELGKCLLLGRGEESGGGRARPSILADAVEALFAAVYLDGGFDKARETVVRIMLPLIKNVTQGGITKDYKTLLQEIVQKNHEERLSYRLIDEVGPDHDKRFTVQVLLNSNIIGNGIGRNKKEAEQAAAREALELMGKG